MVFPAVQPDPDDIPPSWMTRLDLQPDRARPYAPGGVPADPAEAAVMLRRMFPGYDIGCTRGTWRAFRLTSLDPLLQAATAIDLAALIREEMARNPGGSVGFPPLPEGSPGPGPGCH